MFHDAGKLVLAAINPEKFAACIQRAGENGEDLVQIELETMGICHPLLSGALGKMWNFPERLWKLMLYQSNIDKAPNPRMAAVLRLAEFIGRVHELGADGQAPDESIIKESATALGIPVETAPRMISHVMMDEIAKNCRLIADWE